MRTLLLRLLLLLFSGSAYAVDPEEQLSNPVLEKRAREISAGLRCLVCQNQSIDDSDAALAKDLRLIVRQQLQKGESNDQVVDYVTARYGSFVLLKPPFNIHTIVLWVTPIILLFAGVVLVYRTASLKQQRSKTAPLTAAEQETLDQLLNKTSS